MTSFDQSLLTKRSVNYSEAKYWDDIEEMPAWNWLKFIDNGMVKWLVQSGSSYIDNEAMEAWHKLEDQYLQMFGHGTEYEKVLELKYDIWMLYSEYLETGNQDIEMQADMLLVEYRELTKEFVKFNFYKEKARIDSVLSLTIKLKEVSVVEYMSYRELARDVG